MKQYALQWILGTLSLIYAYRLDKKYLKIDKSAIKSFLVFMLWVSAFRIILFTVLPPIVPYISLMNPVTFLGVFSEDALFVLPIFILMDKKKISSLIFWLLFAVSAFLFSLGHLYQGWIGLSAFAYLLASRHFGKKFGFGTVMICHILYDLISFGLLSIFAQGHP